MKEICCEYSGCGKIKIIKKAEYNRAKRKGLKLFCNKICAGLNRRKEKTEEQLKLEKREYDKIYRKQNREILKIKKHNYFKKTYDKEKAALERKKTMKRHVEYCRTPKYKEYKRKYDVVYHAKQKYGELYESALIIKEIEKEIDDKEVRQINNLHNKAQKRKRTWKQLQQNKSYLQRI